METETLHLIISNSAVLLAGLLGAFVAQRTTREDRKAAVEAEQHRWTETQQAEHRVWLRGEKQRAITSFMSETHHGYMVALKVATAWPPRVTSEISEELIALQRSVTYSFNELWLVAPDLRDSAHEVLMAHQAIVLFIAERASETQKDEFRSGFEEVRVRYNEAEAKFLLQAGGAIM